MMGWAEWIPFPLPRAWGRSASRSITAVAPKTLTSTDSSHDGGHAFSVAESRYLAPRSKQDFVLTATHGTRDFGLVSVLRLPREAKPQVTADWVRAVVGAYETKDDVFHTAFLDTVVFSGADGAHVNFTKEAQEYLGKLGNRHVIFVPSFELLPGPYVLIGNELRDVWKITDDSHGTCMATLKPQSNPSSAFESFQCISSDCQFPSFALRSRIKAWAASDSPLAGLRVVVKDNIWLRGTKVSQGNRAFYDTYHPQQESAECIQKLTDKGVTIVGKAKMNSFANWEEPLEYIDYQAPWNPRGDRYQSTGGSSSGSAAALAAYDWLDIAIGTDTWGSVTRPALWCGLFGLRPSLGAVSTKGIEPFCQAYDTAGILARDLQKCRDFAAEWLDPDALVKDPKPFSSIILAEDFWSIIDPKQKEMARQFARMIGAELDIDCHDVSFAKTWTQNPPAEAGGLSLPDYIAKSTEAQCYDAYHNLADFRAKYREQFGCAPYISPANQSMWSFAKTITKEKRDQDFARLEVYERWFNESILSGQHSNSLVIMPLESMVPRYRDEAPTFKRPPQAGVNALALAAVLKSPALAVPVSEITYHSRITNQEEKLPFVVALMGKPGTDLLLLDTVHAALKQRGLPTTVATGKSMFQHVTKGR